MHAPRHLMFWAFVLAKASPCFAQQAAGAARETAAGHAGAPESETLALSYDEALARLDHAPELQARRRAASTLRSARRDVSALPSDLLLTLEAGPRLAATPEAQGRVALSQSFVLASLGTARRDVLSGEAAALEAERIGARLARRVEVARAWLDVYYAHQALGITQAERGLAEDLSRLTARGAELSELTRADAADAAAYAAEAELNVLSAEGYLTDARFELTRCLALADRVLDVQGQPPALSDPTPARQQTLHARVEQQPALLALSRRLVTLDARKREVRALHAPQMALGVVLDRTDPKSWAALGTLGFTLPWQDRAARERAELAAEQTMLSGKLTEQRAAMHVEIERVLHEIAHARETLDQAEHKLIPAVESGLAAREALLRLGEATVLELIVARRAALTLRMRREHLRSDLYYALARFAELSLALGDAQ